MREISMAGQRLGARSEPSEPKASVVSPRTSGALRGLAGVLASVLLAACGSEVRVEQEGDLEQVTVPVEGVDLVVTKQHYIDRTGSDVPEAEAQVYEYDVYRIAHQNTAIEARAYTKDADEAHFVRIEVDGASRALERDDFERPLLRAAVVYLRSVGKARLEWLDASNEAEGYSPVPL
jgi:hypothetical protein